MLNDCRAALESALGIGTDALHLGKECAPLQ